GPGSRPSVRTRPVPGSNERIARWAVAAEVPPAITMRRPTAAAAAYRSGCGSRPTTRGDPPGRKATIVRSDAAPVYPPITYAVEPTTAAAMSDAGVGTVVSGVARPFGATARMRSLSLAAPPPPPPTKNARPTLDTPAAPRRAGGRVARTLTGGDC